MSPDLALALSLADAADAISLGRFRASDLLVETKPDRTPVTEADRAVERRSASASRPSGPDDGMLGEEFGGHRRRQAPLDRRPDRRHAELLARDPGLGDADRARGGRRSRLGVVSAPALGRRWWAERGAGAFVNGEPIRVSPRRRDRGRGALASRSSSRCRRSRSSCWHPRAYGDFWAHMLVAEGAVDGAVDAVGVKVWDLAAIQPIVEEAGGRFSDRRRRRAGGRRHGDLVERAPARRAAARLDARCSAASLRLTSVTLFEPVRRVGIEAAGARRARARTAGPGRPRAAARAAPGSARGTGSR